MVKLFFVLMAYDFAGDVSCQRAAGGGGAGGRTPLSTHSIKVFRENSKSITANLIEIFLIFFIFFFFFFFFNVIHHEAAIHLGS
jgi:hypothetical protein